MQQAAIGASPRTLGSAARAPASIPRFIMAWHAVLSNSKSVLFGLNRRVASEALANTMKYRNRWASSVRAARPPAASEPTAYLTGQLAAVASLLSGRFPSGKQPRTKHNTHMASALAASPRFGNRVGNVQRRHLFSGFEPKTLPNPSVEPTKCSKLHFAAHLER